MSAKVTLQFTVPPGHQKGDYARLYSNGGSGEINWAVPVSNEKFDLFPGGAGLYGWGFAPWGHFRWGNAHSMRTPGWGYLPWGKFPWGHGTTTIMATHKVNDCGQYKYAFGCYDKIDNLHEGTPEEVELFIHIAPAAPASLKKGSHDYDITTGILTLDAA